jgi:hypothetical protein
MFWRLSSMHHEVWVRQRVFSISFTVPAYVALWAKLFYSHLLRLGLGGRKAQTVKLLRKAYQVSERYTSKVRHGASPLKLYWDVVTPDAGEFHVK